MQNNRLIIQYDDERTPAKTESLRCTSMKGAKRIMSKRVRINMKSAIYTDSYNVRNDMRKNEAINHI